MMALSVVGARSQFIKATIVSKKLRAGIKGKLLYKWSVQVKIK